MQGLCYQNIDEISYRSLEPKYNMSLDRSPSSTTICPPNWMEGSETSTGGAYAGPDDRPCYKCAGWQGTWNDGKTPAGITQSLFWNKNAQCPPGSTSTPINCSDEATQIKWGGYPLGKRPSGLSDTLILHAKTPQSSQSLGGNGDVLTAGITTSPMMKYIVGGVIAIVLWKILEK